MLMLVCVSKRLLIGFLEVVAVCVNQPFDTSKAALYLHLFPAGYRANKRQGITSLHFTTLAATQPCLFRPFLSSFALFVIRLSAIFTARRMAPYLYWYISNMVIFKTVFGNFLRDALCPLTDGMG